MPEPYEHRNHNIPRQPLSRVAKKDSEDIEAIEYTYISYIR